MKKIGVLLTITAIALSLYILPASVSAQTVTGTGSGGGTVTGTGSGCSEGDTCLEDPLGNNGDFSIVANKLIKGTLGVVGVLAIIAFIWGGIEWMTSGGSTDRIKKGKNMMVWAILGLIVIFGSYAILNLVFEALGVTTTP